MAGEVTFKTAVKQSTPTKPNLKVGKEQAVSVTNVEVPYLDYESANSKPHSADYFELGDTWQDPTGGFPKEIGLIEEYFENKITSGDIANSTKAVKDRLKEILKVTNMNKEERNLIKIETVAAYIKFLMAKEDIRKSVKRYGYAK